MNKFHDEDHFIAATRALELAIESSSPKNSYLNILKIAAAYYEFLTNPLEISHFLANGNEER